MAKWNLDALEEHEDKVNNPSHYTAGGIEVSDFIEAWDLSFFEGNVIKYVTRAPYKNNKLNDLKKAEWYIKRLIHQAEVEEAKDFNG